MIARTLHLTAIAVLVLAPLASVVGWLPVILLSSIVVIESVIMSIDDIAAWLDGLEAEGL